MKTYSIEEKEKIERILKSEQICFVGFSDKKGIPYVLPMNYGYENGIIYLLDQIPLFLPLHCRMLRLNQANIMCT